MPRPAISQPTTPSRRKRLLFVALICLGYLVFAEALARGIFVALSASPLPLLYGFDRDIKFVAESTLLKPVFFCTRNEPGDGAEASTAGSGARLVLAFGGSTTQGGNCSSGASSWPAELATARTDLEVVNHGLNGTNSDYAIGRLEAALGERVPDLVLWANWANELDVVYEGPRRNRGPLAARFGAYLARHQRDYVLARGTTLLARLDRTLYDVSGLYLLLARALDQFERNSRGERERGRVLGAEDRDFAIANTLINLEAARALSRRHGFALAVVRLPILWSRFERDHGGDLSGFLRDWNDLLMAKIERFAEANGVFVLDLQGKLDQEGDAGIYCDSVHMVRAGHRRLAAALIEAIEAAGLLPKARGS